MILGLESPTCAMLGQHCQLWSVLHRVAIVNIGGTQALVLVELLCWAVYLGSHNFGSQSVAMNCILRGWPSSLTLSSGLDKESQEETALAQ